MRSIVPTLIVLLAANGVFAETEAERGKKALTGRHFTPPIVTRFGFQNLWKQWDLKEKPSAEEFARRLRERYGLHPAPFLNEGLPMGLRYAPLRIGLGQGVSVDCLVCHGGSIAGKSYVGLGNTSLEIHALFQETARADGRAGTLPFRFGNVRGTSEAGGMSVFLLGYREPDLSLRVKRVDLELHDDLCEDVPAWWLLKKKKSMYWTGGSDQRSVRSIMQFMMSPLNGPSVFEKEEATFRDVRAYLLSLEPPKYPLAIDGPLAAAGKKLFETTCAKCHGTYGENWTYPNKIIPINEIGTDRRRYDGITRKFGEYYNQSWFAQEKENGGYPVRATAGYQAPPLDGIWATAPYFHNGNSPTLYHVLNSRARPTIFTRSYRTDLDAYDARNVGWKVELLKSSVEPGSLPPIEFRRIYDTTQPGRGNGGHTYGDKLSEADRWAVIEYLKTL